MRTIFTTLFFLSLFTIAEAQSAESIINDCKAALGGANWDKVNSIKYSTVLEQGGMQIPLEIFQMRDGRMYVKFNYQGMEIVQAAYDGTTLWSTNFMTQKAEKSTSEDTENHRRTCKEFPNALASWKDLGYTPTLEGEQDVDGAKCYKIRLDKKTQLIEGKELPSIEYYYIDKDSKALIMSEEEFVSGEMKGKIGQTKLSDYQEVNGVFIPFSQTEGIKDGFSQTMSFKTVEINTPVDEKIFQYKGE
ncbi:MAG: outer membrane lipoprotein-sorting protein [Flavobacteriales bacterium]